MRTAVVAVILGLLLVAGIAGGWVAMTYYAPGSIGSPAHAGAVSNGRPDQCTNLSFGVRARSQEARTVRLNKGDILRGTFEADGGLGNVDIFMRIVTPQGLEMYASPKTNVDDFFFPAQIAGDYTFEFDNRYSMYTSKAIGFFYCVQPQP
ncbi:MAG: emp24/gp25L/p24 family protein [Panacagrimonas sp.]